MRATTIFGLIIAIGMCDPPLQTQEFTLTTTQANTTSSRSSIDMPGLTGNPLAIIVATPVGNTAALNQHPIGAWYYSGKWNIFNSDHRVMPIGAQYHVQFFTAPGPNQFMHTVTSQNLGSEGTYIDNAALNKNPQARVKILQNYAPEVRTPYHLNGFEEKVSYSSAAGRWYIANSGGEPISKGTVYNVVIETQAPAGSPATPPGGQGGAEVKEGAKPPPPTAPEIKEKLDKANKKLNELAKEAANSGNKTSGTGKNEEVKEPPKEATNPGPGGSNAAGTKKMTGFVVSTHGFRFANTFKNSPFGPPIQVVTSGLCGGMSYAALDCFLAGVEIPKQDYRPAHGSTLQSYLYQRQETSLYLNIPRWVSYHFNPLGNLNLQIFNWGLREQLAELRTYIDRGVPVPLGLKWTGGDLVGKDHQVLAIGYDMGSYNGDVGDRDHIKDLKIFVCEPNYPGRIITLAADADKLEFYYVELPGVRWRSYFVDREYRAMAPPTVPIPVEFQDQVKDGLVHALRFEFFTGQQELLGGPIHVNLKILFKDGTMQDHPNISQSGRWLSDSVNYVEVLLTTPRRIEDIQCLELLTNATISASAQHWDMKKVNIKAMGGGSNWLMELRDPAPHKFVGLPVLLFPK